MIGALSGFLLQRRKDSIILMVGGVGYHVFVTQQVLKSTVIHDELTLFIYTHVRQDTLSLFGFRELHERELFELLLSVSGVGPKTALSIVDLGAERITTAVTRADVGFFTSIPRLGKKNSQKIIIELKNKLGGLTEFDLGKDDETNELIDALVNVGFTKVEVGMVVRDLPGDLVTLEEKLKYSLKQLGQKKL